MLEKSPSHTTDADDATRVKSADASSETTQNTPPFNAPHEEATRMMTNQAYTGSYTDIQLDIGSIIKNTYELVAVLGEGGMGTVYKALNKDWAEVGARDPYVALKVLKPELSDNRELVMGLFREFDRTKMLANCPNNIKVHDFGRDGPHVYMTMEYLTGQTLGEYLKHQAMNLAQAWFIIDGVGNALAYAHENNIVHRDIKPGNIFITQDGVVKVLDFGIASKINENENEDDKTKFNGDDMGAFTLAYASPDTRLGDPPDCRDDIYSFACVIYEILTGKKFFNPKRKSKKSEPIQGLNSKQMDALNKALAFERDMRTGSIRELLDKLRSVKIPWIKYISIGSSVCVIAGLMVWGIKELTTPADIKQTSVTPAIPAPVIAPVSLPPPLVVVPQPQAPAPVATPTIQAPELTSAPNVAEYSATSSDGIIHLETSKPEYKNGEPFQLSYTLSLPMYVRVIDRDVKGIVTTLRPNPRQPDKLLPADKEQVFPPKGFNVPVTGPTGTSIVTIVASTQPFPKTMPLLNHDGSISDQVLNGSYSWTQVHYRLHQ